MKWTVGTKIGFAFTVILLFVILFGVLANLSIRELITSGEWRQHSYQVLNNLNQLFSQLQDAETGQRGYLLTGKDSYLKPYLTAQNSLDAKLNVLLSLTKDNPSQQHNIEILRPLINDKLAELKGTIDLYQSGDKANALQLVNSDKGKKFMDAIRVAIGNIKTHENLLLSERTQSAKATANITLAVITYGILLTIIIVIVIGVLITNNIVKPLRAVTLEAGKIAKGDLKIHFDNPQRQDEVGELVTSFMHMAQSLQSIASIATQISTGNLAVSVEPQSSNDILGNALTLMVKNLQTLISDIKSAVEVLSSSIDEIPTSSVRLTTNATETAAAVNETTVTMEQVRQASELATQKTRSVADNAQKVNKITQGGKTAVIEMEEGMAKIHAQMNSIAESMLHLSERSLAIGEIIVTADDLAEQSNLLAVNAAIEAAKAGEHGRGFTVIAQEIKHLSEQSKEATHHVRSALGDIQKATSMAVLATEQGSKTVEDGTTKSKEAEETITVLDNNISETIRAVSDISAASYQQLMGVQQVAIAMENIREASSRNAESTKQMEQATEHLKELSLKFKTLVAQYQL
jgi:methyl-accepting chemotaxis protein